MTTERVIAGKVDVRQLLRNRPKPVLPTRNARIPAEVSFDGKASATATLVEIMAEDRPGLLYDLASAEGRKVEPEKRERLEEALREACEPGGS